MPITAVAILVNPKAGKGTSGHLAEWLGNQLELKQIRFSIFVNDWPDQFDDFSDIWITGGDGSINYFINRFPNCKIPLTLYKTGTGNDFAWKLYGDISNHQIYKKSLESLPRPVDAGKCNNTLFINSFGIGFDGEILRSMNTIRFLGGHIGYLIAVLIKIFSYHEPHFKISSATESWDDRFLLVIINNSSQAGGGFRITPTAEINDGKLNMLLCKKLSLLQRLRYLPVLKKGTHLSLPFIIHRLGKSFSICADKILSIQVDGELMEAQKLQIELLPAHFLFRY
ncbi:MAG: hypothetical protein K2Q21_14285 [Chitinophagaceae bacterium]|nr:hypothetical protein [Chitinophagaceae bacterium]